MHLEYNNFTYWCTKWKLVIEPSKNLWTKFHQTTKNNNNPNNHNNNQPHIHTLPLNITQIQHQKTTAIKNGYLNWNSFMN